MRHHAPPVEENPLRKAIQAIVVNSKSEHDLVNQIEALVKSEVEAVLAIGEEGLSMPGIVLGGEG